MDLLSAFLGRNNLLPHGYCIAWSPALLWSMVAADAVIALAYFSIPLAILSFVRRRSDWSLNWVALLFVIFIFGCGVTHAMEIWTIWQPVYGLQALAKSATATVSIITAFMLWPLIPKALAIPSVDQLQSTIRSLQAEMEARRTTEDHLAETQQSLAVTLASIGAGFIATDRAGCVTRMNAVAERVTGWTEPEARGRSLWQVFDREDRPAGYLARNPVDVMVENNITIEDARHLTAIARDGTRTSLEVKAALTRAADGSPRGIAVVFRDLGPQIRAAAESNRLAAIVESSYDAIVGKALDGTITSWNTAAQSLFGYAAEEVIGRSVLMLVPPERETEERQIMAALARGTPVPSFDTVRVAKDGRRIEVSVTISPIHDDRGQIIGASKIARDVSLQRRAEAALRDSELKSHRLEVENRQIQESNRLKSQFLANMSHELRTPLNAIIGFADLLQTGMVPPDSPQHRKFLGHIGTSGRHLLQLINDVLDLAKVEAGRLEFHPEPIELTKLVQEIDDILHTAKLRKQIVLRTELDASLTDLFLDAARLKQVLYNYLSNAIKFTPSGGAIVVRARPDGPRHFRLEVEDTGIGIAAEDLPRLFMEFEQLESGYNKRHQGTGLGLALTRRLVELQGGRVGVRSERGVGSVFHLVLNRVHGTDAAVAIGRDTIATQRARWLVIEDSRPLDASLAPALSEAGLDVDSAATAEEALRHAGRTPYDAITLELLLPDQPGLGVLEGIRARGPSRDSPVVAVSISAGPEAVAGFAVSNVLTKPLKSHEVVAAMARLPTHDGRRRRVMVVDDDPLALDLMRATLGTIGIDTTTFVDGRRALEAVDTIAPDAIVLDLMMPELDGFTVLAELKRHPARKDTPVFIWTSMFLTDEEYGRLARSARAILSKGGGALDATLADLRRRFAARSGDAGPDTDRGVAGGGVD